MDAHILLSPVGQKTETRFNCFLTENRKSTEMVGTPSTVRKLLPPLRTPSTVCGRSPSLEEGGLGAARALSNFLLLLRVQGRNPGRFNGGYGVPRGFKGEKSKFPPNPLGLAERVHSFHRCGGPPPSRREVWGFAGQGLRPCRRVDIGALRSPLSPFARRRYSANFRFFLPKDLPLRGRGTARRRWKEYRSHLTPSVTAAPCQLPQRGSSLIGLFPA